MSRRVRRSPFLVTYWEGETHLIYNYSRSRPKECSPLVLGILARCSDWTALETLKHDTHVNEVAFEETVAELIRDGFLVEQDVAASATDAALAQWRRWNPAAGFFHAVSRGMRPSPRTEVLRHKGWYLLTHPSPPALKEVPGARTNLPAFGDEPLAAVLQKRRTWRAFGDRGVSLEEISTLLGLTFGVQHWFVTGDEQRVALKTSPAGGARHSIEAYLLAFDVDGLDTATYHYNPDEHALIRLDVATTKEMLEDFLPEQPGFHDAAAIVVMTSVFERMQWKYAHPHAYRVVLLDAGHLGQTFALLATSQKLAPFCTAALDSALVERHLGIDGFSEAPVLVLGVGSRPDGKEWSYKHDHSENPRTMPPAWAERMKAFYDADLGS